MTFRTVNLPETVKGTLLLDAMPGRDQPWNEFLAEADKVKLNNIVSLSGEDEIRRYSPSYQNALANGKFPFNWNLIPMRDFGLAIHEEIFSTGVNDIVTALQAGKVVLLHCAGGRGRTGATAACVLKALGLPREEAIKRVEEAGSSAESAEQTGLVDKF